MGSGLKERESIRGRKKERENLLSHTKCFEQFRCDIGTTRRLGAAPEVFLSPSLSSLLLFLSLPRSLLALSLFFSHFFLFFLHATPLSKHAFFHAHTPTHPHTHTRTSIHTHTRTHAHTHTRTHAHTHTPTHPHTHTPTPTHPHTHTLADHANKDMKQKAPSHVCGVCMR